MSADGFGYRRVFCDTSFFFACLSPHDACHSRANELAKQAAEAGAILSTTWDVIGETVTLLRYRRNHQAALDFLDILKPRLDVVPYDHSIRLAAEEVFRRYGAVRRLSFCDAISFMVVTTLLNNTPCLSFDQDFRALGLTVLG